MFWRKRTYLDYAAGVRGNPSSPHEEGRLAKKMLEDARTTIARLTEVQSDDVIFTSGATEGNNAVIKSFSRAVGGQKSHVIVSAIEHDCVLASAERLEKEGLAEISRISVDREGIVEVGELKKAIKENTVLVSVMYVNNEIGTVQPIEEIGKMLAEINKGRQNKICFHTDAAQATNYFSCDVKKLGVDFLTLSAHKIYGPKGVGALFVRRGAPFQKFMDGGEQEFKFRAGTHNTPGIVGLGAAIRKVQSEKFKVYPEPSRRVKSLQDLRDKLINGVLDKVSGAALNGSLEKRSPNNVNFRFEGVEGEAMLVSLDLEGIAVSTGSACAAKSLNPSHVLLAMGLNHLQTHSSLRFSLGRFTTEAEIDKVLEVLPRVVEKLRAISGNFKGEGVERGKLPDNFGC